VRESVCARERDHRKRISESEGENERKNEKKQEGTKKFQAKSPDGYVRRVGWGVCDWNFVS